MRYDNMNRDGADYLAPSCEVLHFDINAKILESSDPDSTFGPDSYIWDKDEF